MARNEPRRPPQAPPVFTKDVNTIIQDTKRVIDHSRSVQEEILATIKPEEASFQNVILPLAHAHNLATREAPILSFYERVSPDPELRNASTKAAKLLADFEIEGKMHRGLFDLIDAVVKRGEHLDPESRRLLERNHKDCIRHGLSLPVQQRDRFEEVQKQLVQLISQFQKNLADGAAGTWFTAQELDGVPVDMIAELEQGEKENEGKVLLTYSFPHLFTTLKYARNGETRKLYYLAHENKCSPNVPLFKEIMVLRHEAAQLLGYPNHAAFRIETKMAKTPENVNAFLDDLRSRLSAGGRNDVEQMRLLKHTDVESRGEPFDGKFYLWDYTFYNRLTLETQYSVDRQEIAEYFPLQTTVTGVIGIFERLFGLVVEEIVSEKRDDLVWQEDVQVFAVWDDEGEGGGFLGYLYLDLFPRAGKFGGMANFNLQGGFTREDGSRHHPATALVCNFTKPTADKPSLLNHDEVQLLFHELGHGIHDLVAKTTYSIFHGTSTVDDFCETPSQMLEYWCWVPSLLQSLSHHFSYISPEYLAAWQSQTGSEGTPTPPKRLSDDMVNGLIKTKNVYSSLYQLRLLHRSYFDMRVHQPKSLEAIRALDISAEWNRLQTEISHLETPDGEDWGHGHANFDALMRAYDAGFYGYLYSRVYATDMFYSVFKRDPMNGSEGRRYRHTLIGKGASKDEMETLVEFLGREPSTEAFHKELGLC